MIILDTNVVSEMTRNRPNPRVLAWLDKEAPRSMFLTIITVAELRAGIERLAPSRKRTDLDRRIEATLVLFGTRILTLDMDSAYSFGCIMAKTRARGRRVEFADGLIAAIAESRGATVATRDAQPFRNAGVAVVDPWTDLSGA